VEKIMYKRSLYIFRQDLRLQDNTGLIEAVKNSEEIFPIFIHDTRAIEDFGREDPRFGFIREALESIDTELQKYSGRVTVYSWDPEKILEDIVEKYQIDALFMNRSYSPKWKERDNTLQSICENNHIQFHSYQDFLLVEPHEVEQRKVFTPFSMLWKKYILAHPERLNIRVFEGSRVRWFIPDDRREIWEVITVPHHRYWSLALGRERMERDYTHYDDLRNLPAIDGSTRLSPYIRFGVYSVRELYAKFVPKPSLKRGYREAGGDLVSEVSEQNPQSSLHSDSSFTKELSETLLNELIWREFWYHIAHYFPTIYSLEFQERKRSIEWNRDESSYEWDMFQKGKTGYPLVDAAIRQLIETNWMHNRLRMVVASFLTKNLGIDWRIGEKWFKKYLIDYDEAVNYGNWQWSASVGADPKPVRIFNPLLQSEKFDAECKFIKKYLPELEWVDPKDIHTLNLRGIYIAPVVDQKESAARARERYRS
jgi:deoxyribodipyrimidine photo-lyase